MLRQMPGRADQLAGELQRQAQAPVIQVEVQLLGMPGLDPLRAPAPDLGGEQLDEILGQPQRLADIAQCAFGPVADHRRAQGGMIAAVGVEHPLHDDLAPLVLEVDIDVGRLAALLADEAFEQQVMAVGIDGGDAEHVADRGIGGRAPALAQNVLTAGEADDGVDGQEIGRVAQARDQPQLMGEEVTHLVRHPLGVAPGSPRPGQLLQRLLRCQARDRDLLRILVGELAECEAALLGDLERAGQCLRVAGEQPGHFRRRLSGSGRHGDHGGIRRHRWCSRAGCR